MEELNASREWALFHSFRSCTRPPGGETAVEVQARVLADLDRLRKAHRDDTILAVSHADVIRVILVHFAGMPLDLLHRLRIEPASVSVVRLGDEGVQIARVNDTNGFDSL